MAQQSAYITQTAGNLTVASVTSNTGSIGLGAFAGNVDLGTLNAKAGNTTVTASGSILDTNSTPASAINTVNANLVAQNGSVGLPATPLDVDATGQIAAQGKQGVFVNQTAGSMNVGTISSQGGNVNLTAPAGNVTLGTINAAAGNTTITAAGSILNTNNTGASTINTQAANLTAQTGSIGSVSTPLPIDAIGLVTAQSFQDAYLTQTAGTLNINSITSSTGNVGLMAATGNVDLGTVNSLKGNTSITAYGSILDTNHLTASDINADYLGL